MVDSIDRLKVENDYCMLRYGAFMLRSVIVSNRHSMFRPICSTQFRKTVGLVALALNTLVCLSPGTATAQTPSSQKATAQALFDEGVRLLRAGSYQEACAKLETSHHVDPAVGTLLYLGECFERVGRTASAWASFRDASALAQATNQTERKKVADERANRLQGDLAWLRIEVTPETRAIPDLQIRRASEPVPIDLSGNDTPVDPGEILVEASAPGHASFSAKVTLVPRGHAVITIPWLRELPATAAPPAPPPAPVTAAPQTAVEPARPEQSPTPPPATRRSTLPWILDGVGIVGLGIGAAFGVVAINKASDARDACPDTGAVKGLCTTQVGSDAQESAKTAAVISNVAFAVGGAALATGIVLHFVLPPQTEKSAVRVTPILDRSTVGLALTGRLGL